MTSSHPSPVSIADPPGEAEALASLGARLAVLSRHRQGLAPGVSDPAVLTELRHLCAAPRPARGTAVAEREGPAS